MEEQKTNQKTSINSSSTPIRSSDHGHNDPPTPAAEQGGDTPEEEDSGKTSEPKKRKGCPSALEKCEALIKKKNNSPLNSSYSFTFDTKFCGGSGFAGTPETTPKFGSFNLVAGTVIESKEDAGEEEEEGKEGEVELELKRDEEGKEGEVELEEEEEEGEEKERK